MIFPHIIPNSPYSFLPFPPVPAPQYPFPASFQPCYPHLPYPPNPPAPNPCFLLPSFANPYPPSFLSTIGRAPIPSQLPHQVSLSQLPPTRVSAPLPSSSQRPPLSSKQGNFPLPPHLNGKAEPIFQKHKNPSTPHPAFCDSPPQVATPIDSPIHARVILARPLTSSQISQSVLNQPKESLQAPLAAKTLSFKAPETNPPFLASLQEEKEGSKKKRNKRNSKKVEILYQQAIRDLRKIAKGESSISHRSEFIQQLESKHPTYSQELIRANIRLAIRQLCAVEKKTAEKLKQKGILYKAALQSPKRKFPSLSGSLNERMNDIASKLSKKFTLTQIKSYIKNQKEEIIKEVKDQFKDAYTPQQYIKAFTVALSLLLKYPSEERLYSEPQNTVPIISSLSVNSSVTEPPLKQRKTLPPLL